MTAEELSEVHQALEKWRKDHTDINALRKAYLANIPKQVRASMAFEGESVSLKMLEDYMESLIARNDKKSR